MLVLSAPITYRLGLTSWRLIEWRALSLKRRVATPTRDPRVPSVA
jgi:hypothetical protein